VKREVLQEKEGSRVSKAEGAMDDVIPGSCDD
jgi:hypothetical protein